MNDLQRQIPDFTDGDQFLIGVRQAINRRQIRNRWFASATTIVATVLIFISSFNALESRTMKDAWESYLISEMSYFDVDAELQADAELYISWLLEEENFDQLLSGIYDLGLEQDLIFAYNHDSN